jgi:hypothetical protein
MRNYISKELLIMKKIIEFAKKPVVWIAGVVISAVTGLLIWAFHAKK